MADALPFTTSVPRNVSLIRLVSEVARTVGTIGKVIVEGEVHRVTTSAAKRTYFTLKDRGAQVSVAIPSARQKYCHAKDGQRVIVTGQLEFVTDRGQLQLVASEVSPVGAGAIAELIKERRERMRADGLLDRLRLQLPLLPNMVGVVCGADAAVRKDIESVVTSRFAGFPLRFQEVTVSGSGAIESITAGLSILQADPRIDVIIIARGGGDATQLLPFSDEDLCRTIASSRVPIISAIGHDGDTPLSDDVADHRAGTPSIAAAMAVPEQHVLHARIDRALLDTRAYLERRMERSDNRLAQVSWHHAVDRRLERSQHRLGQVAIDPVVARLSERATARLAGIDWHRGIQQHAAAASLKLGALIDRVEALSPARVLERGYAVVRTVDGIVVRDCDSVSVGDAMVVTLARGELTATISAARLSLDQRHDPDSEEPSP